MFFGFEDWFAESFGMVDPLSGFLFVALVPIGALALGSLLVWLAERDDPPATDRERDTSLRLVQGGRSTDWRAIDLRAEGEGRDQVVVRLDDYRGGRCRRVRVVFRTL